MTRARERRKFQFSGLGRIDRGGDSIHRSEAITEAASAASRDFAGFIVASRFPSGSQQDRRDARSEGRRVYGVVVL